MAKVDYIVFPKPKTKTVEYEIQFWDEDNRTQLFVDKEEMETLWEETKHNLTKFVNKVFDTHEEIFTIMVATIRNGEADDVGDYMEREGRYWCGFFC